MVENNSRLKKEYQLPIKSDNFKASFGTVNRIYPSVIYVKINCWVKYEMDVKKYNEDINDLNNSIKQTIKKQINIAQNFTDSFFYTPSIKKLLVNNNSSFHACFEITLKQKEPMLYDISLLNDKLIIFVDNFTDLLEKNHRFIFKVKK